MWRSISVREPLRSIISNRPRERGIYDLTELPVDPSNQNRYIFGIIDVFSRKVWATALLQTFRGQYFHLWQADNGGEFVSHEISNFIKEVGGEEIHSAPRHPQTNGHIERFWGSIKPFRLQVKMVVGHNIYRRLLISTITFNILQLSLLQISSNLADKKNRTFRSKRFNKFRLLAPLSPKIVFGKVYEQTTKRQLFNSK